MRNELKQLKTIDPDDQLMIHSVCCPSDNLHQIEAIIKGPPETPYSGGYFTIELEIPDKYPFVPPKVYFKTPIQHPNSLL